MSKPNRWATALVLAMLLVAAIGPLIKAAAAPQTLGISPVLGASASYSVLAGETVTCDGSTTTTGDVGVSPGTAITGFPTPCVAGPPGTTHSNDVSAIAAQADNLVVFGVLDQPCDQSFGAVDLTATFPSGVGPGVYCSTSSFSLTGNLTLTGSGVWIFKTVSSLITSPGSSVTGGDPCNVWWRVGSSATVDTTTSFIGSIFALTSITLNTGATLDGRALAQNGQVELHGNTITGPNCSASATSTSAAATDAAATTTSIAATNAAATGAAGTSTSAAQTATAAASITPNTAVPGSTNTPVPLPTNTLAPTALSTATAPAIVGLPATGGAPLQRGDFTWVLALIASGLTALAFGWSVRARRRGTR